ncbi:MAG: hypothetical protein V3W31_09380 [Thermodesulfobacteriota bacterium]
MSEEIRQDGEIPGWQKFYDNIWLLLVIGNVLPTLVFTVWGLYEVFNVPPLQLR